MSMEGGDALFICKRSQHERHAVLTHKGLTTGAPGKSHALPVGCITPHTALKQNGITEDLSRSSWRLVGSSAHRPDFGLRHIRMDSIAFQPGQADRQAARSNRPGRGRGRSVYWWCARISCRCWACCCLSCSARKSFIQLVWPCSFIPFFWRFLCQRRCNIYVLSDLGGRDRGEGHYRTYSHVYRDALLAPVLLMISDE